ncbi:MAG: hypothetical protein ACTSWC_07605 [Promethearchaeota archaeon]
MSYIHILQTDDFNILAQCSCILVLDQIYIYLYNLMSIELITALREAKSLTRDVGWLTFLHNPCWGD